jgi:hypothetical protein
MEVEPRDHAIAIERDVIAQTRRELRIGLDAVKGSIEFGRDAAFMDKVGNVRLDPRRAC